MQKDAEILNIIIDVFPDLVNDYKELVNDGPTEGDAYEFTTITMLPYIYKGIQERGNVVAEKTIELMNRLLSSDDKDIRDFGMAIVVDEIAYLDLDFDYFLEFADDHIKNEIKPLILNCHGDQK